MSYAEVLARVCRVCLKHCAPTSRMAPLYSTDGPPYLTDVARSVIALTDVTIAVDDQMPPQICYMCLDLLKKAIAFKLICERSHRCLQRVLAQSKLCNAEVQAEMVQYSMFANYFPDYISGVCKEDGEGDSEGVGNGENHVNTVFTEDDDASEQVEDMDGVPDEMIKLEEAAEMTGLSPEEIWFYKKVTKCLITDKKSLGASDLAAKLNPTDAKVSKLSEMVSQRRRQRRCEARRPQEALLGTRYPERERRPAESLVCGRCGKRYSSRGSLRTHMHRHTGFKFICEHCGKGFATKNEMDVHSMALHGLEKHFACHLCHFKAKRRAELTDHVRAHTGERPYACETCGLTFRRKPILRKHLAHHQEKQFKCDQCPKMFYHRNHLAAHANNVHRRRYLYRCSVPACPATYAKSASVRKHLRDLHGVPREQQSRVLRVPLQAATAAPSPPPPPPPPLA